MKRLSVSLLCQWWALLRVDSQLSSPHTGTRPRPPQHARTRVPPPCWATAPTGPGSCSHSLRPGEGQIPALGTTPAHAGCGLAMDRATESPAGPG